MDVEQQPASPEAASQACTSCRKQKRKCDKRLPSCGLCERIGRSCDYSEEARGLAPSPEEFTALRQEVAELKDLLVRGALATNSDHGVASNGHTSHQDALSLGDFVTSEASHACSPLYTLGSVLTWAVVSLRMLKPSPGRRKSVLLNTQQQQQQPDSGMACVFIISISFLSGFVCIRIRTIPDPSTVRPTTTWRTHGPWRFDGTEGHGRGVLCDSPHLPPYRLQD